MLSLMIWYFLQMVVSALCFAQSEVIWYFQHVGIASSKSKAARMVPVDVVSEVFLPFIALISNHKFFVWQPANEV